MHYSGGTRVRSNTDHMGGSRLACARYTQDPIREASRLLDASGSAGVLSRGVGLRGFESHPPHHCTGTVLAGFLGYLKVVTGCACKNLPLDIQSCNMLHSSIFPSS
jgi:hypothetical protein